MIGWKKLWTIVRHPLQCLLIYRYIYKKRLEFMGWVNGVPLIAVIPKLKHEN